MGTRAATSEIKLNFSSTISNTLTDNQVASAQVGAAVYSGQITNGVSAGQANRGWENLSYEISSGNSEDWDLYDMGTRDIGAGAGKDALGQSWVAEEIVCIVIKQTGGTGRLEIMPSSPAGALTWMPALTVANGGALRTNACLCMISTNTDAFDISDGVSHVLRLKANGGNAIFDMYILARHDDDESSSSSVSSSSSSNSSSSTSSSSESSSLSTSSSSVSSSSSSSSSPSSFSTSSLSSSSSSSSSSP